MASVSSSDLKWQDLLNLNSVRYFSCVGTEEPVPLNQVTGFTKGK
jgi:hypothetical protein